MARSCGTVQNYFRQLDLYPELRRNQALLESMTGQIARRSSSIKPVFPRLIPVVVHMLYQDEADNISDAADPFPDRGSERGFLGKKPRSRQCAGSVQAVHRRPWVSNSTLRPSIRPGLATNGITRRHTSVTSFGVDDTMKSEASGGKSPWDTKRYLNIWVCRLNGGLLGYAQFPGGDPATDGVVINTMCFGRGGSAQDPFNHGRTATHEVGHYLNLSHIWGDARVPTCSDSDHVDDAPNQWGPNTGKVAFPSPSCRKSSAWRYVHELHGLCR